MTIGSVGIFEVLSDRLGGACCQPVGEKQIPVPRVQEFAVIETLRGVVSASRVPEYRRITFRGNGGRAETI